jgi:hypothetical protein
LKPESPYSTHLRPTVKYYEDDKIAGGDKSRVLENDGDKLVLRQEDDKSFHWLLSVYEHLLTTPKSTAVNGKV